MSTPISGVLVTCERTAVTWSLRPAGGAHHDVRPGRSMHWATLEAEAPGTENLTTTSVPPEVTEVVAHVVAAHQLGYPARP